ncbi:hypothetical protein [Coxiella burnetii]|nr:hypothetical protein [Coxiella burnetii]ACJ17520.1 hypothetical cytosolic protein [Coxiella burnetii CbuG_Q212]ATN65992.1 hypothetical protein AYM17_00260 [Coxiella burnetii]OYK87099.1 hypothetical protein CbuQ229_00290 [Coxiella burnetii]
MKGHRTSFREDICCIIEEYKWRFSQHFNLPVTSAVKALYSFVNS